MSPRRSRPLRPRIQSPGPPLSNGLEPLPRRRAQPALRPVAPAPPPASPLLRQLAPARGRPVVVETGDLKAYFEQARLWEQDLLLQAHRSKRLAWTVAAFSSALSIASVGAVAAMAPLKTVEPFVIRVDNATGIVDVVSALRDGPTAYGEAVTRYFLAKYVRAREAYSRSEAEANFKTVSLLSDGSEQTRFAAFYRGPTPETPKVAYARPGLAEVRIKTISLLGPNLASVRFLRETRKGDETRTSHWIATLTFEVRPDAKVSTSDRLVNPIGFLVSRYHADPEVVP